MNKSTVVLHSLQQLRMINRLRLARSFINGTEPHGAVPTASYIETTSRCNLECPMCARQLSGANWHDRDMTLDEFDQAHAALAPECELLLPFAGGEPLLHQHIAQIVARSSREGRRTEIATNATLLNGRISRELLRAGLDTLIISLDAATAETYTKIRHGGDFERTRAGIMTFLRWKAKLRAKTWVTIQMVVLPENRGEMTELYRQWRHVRGVDSVRFKGDEVHVERIRQKKFRRPTNQIPCHFPWIGPLMIRYDGAVYPCCHSWRGEPVGHVAKESTRAIWNGPNMTKLRRAHLEGRAGEEYPACRECQAVIPHSWLVTGSLLVPPHITRRAIPYFEALNRRLGQHLIQSS